MNNTLIGLVTYNNLAFTKMTIKSLMVNTLSLTTSQSRLVVIDNGSTDGTVEWLQMAYPWVKVITDTKDCITYQWNQFLELREPGEDFLMIPNDVAFGHPEWLENLAEDTYKNSEVIVGSPYMNCDLAYDEVIDQYWNEKYKRAYPRIRGIKDYRKLTEELQNLYDGNFPGFCADFAKRNAKEPPIDFCLTHVMLFKAKLFDDHNFKFSEEYCPYYGSHEFDTRARLNNMGYYSISSSRSYVHHWVSISNNLSKGDMNEKEKAIDKNNVHLLQKWEPIVDSVTYLGGSRPSRCPNWQSPYFRFRERKELLSEEEARKVPGIRFLNFQGLVPGQNYFHEIQPGSVISYASTAAYIHARSSDTLFCKGKDGLNFPIDYDDWVDNKWAILHWYRPEETEQNQYWKEEFEED